MPRLELTIPFYLPTVLYRLLHLFKPRRGRPIDQHSSNERDVEWPFCAAHMPTGPGAALDFGCGRSPLGFLAALRGFRVTAIDLEPIWLPYSHPNLRFVRGDLFELALPEKHFDLIINCSSIEHVGLAGRYGVTLDKPDGDLEAMHRLWELMKPGTAMLLTVPVGKDVVLAPMHRVYGHERLPRLLLGFTVEHQEYWMKDDTNRWHPCSKHQALSFPASGNPEDPSSFTNALGCFVLRKPYQEASEDGRVSSDGY